MSNEPTQDVAAAIDRARDRLRKAAAAQVAAEAEYNAAEQELYDAHMAAFGSASYRRAKYTEDQQAIRREAGFRA